ncbi:MAG: hypothetical protein FJX77_10415 [Armatimonadetes bacterium]|nr:hypothetical protein [Armatimonadota bacterium]
MTLMGVHPGAKTDEGQLDPILLLHEITGPSMAAPDRRRRPPLPDGLTSPIAFMPAPGEAATVTLPTVALRDYLQVFWRRRKAFLQMFVLVLGLGVASTYFKKPVYRTSARLMIPPAWVGTRIDISETSNPVAPLMSGAAMEDLDSQVQLLRSSPFQASAREKAGARANGVGLMVEGEIRSSTITITASGRNPEHCAVAANALLDLQQEYSRNRQTAGLEKTLVVVFVSS